METSLRVWQTLSMFEPKYDSSKLAVFIDLMRIVESGFIHKLKVRRPTITDDEIARELKRWYMDRPGAGHGDSDGVIGDVSRFLNDR